MKVFEENNGAVVVSNDVIIELKNETQIFYLTLYGKDWPKMAELLEFCGLQESAHVEILEFTNRHEIKIIARG